MVIGHEPRRKNVRAFSPDILILRRFKYFQVINYMSNKEELEKIITLIEPYSKGNNAIEAIINTITTKIAFNKPFSDAEKDKIYTDITNVLSDSEIKTILDKFSKIKDEETNDK